MQLERHNADTYIRKAPGWFLNYAARHLSVPVEPGTGTEQQFRFGVHWTHVGAEGPRRYASLLRQNTVPAGLTAHVEALAAHYGLPCHVTDARKPPEEYIPLWSLRAAWRPYQEDVHRQVQRYETGVVDAPPRSGKTLMAARIIDTLNQPTVWIAPSVQIVRQTFGVLKEHFGGDYVSRLDGSAKPEDKDPEKKVVVTTPISAARMPAEWWATRTCLIIDEFHHSAADTYHRISALATNAYYRYGFTGTHYRTGDDRLAMEAICSYRLHKITVPYLVDNGWLAQPKVVISRVNGSSGGTDFATAYRKGIVEFEPRNEMVVSIAKQCLSQGIPTLVLTRRRKHADAIADRIRGAVVVKGGENAMTSQAVLDFTAGKHECLVGTTVIGEGVDVPRAGALVYACGGNDGVMMMQSYFRPLTATPGKDYGYIYDFYDAQHSTLRKHSARRIEMVRNQLGPDCLVRP